MIRVQRSNSSQSTILVILLAVFALLTGLYFVLRFSGWTMEVDSSRQADAANGIVETGKLINPTLYNNGFGYGIQLAFLSLITGLSVQTIQISSSVWVFVLALVAFITYRELLMNNTAAALAVFLLFIQPDFLFYIVRGSHERNTWIYALLMIFLLARSYHYLQNTSKLLVYISLFYIVYWAFLSSNVYFAATFMSAILFSFVGGWVLSRVSGRNHPLNKTKQVTLQRLTVISLTCFILLFVFITYAYKPALQIYYLFTTMSDRISLMVLGTQQAETPLGYQYLSQTWRSQQAYLALTGVQWLITLLSLVAWGFGLGKLSKMDQNSWLLWLLYSAFGVLMVLGMVADYAGFLSSNLQLRMFTPFTLFSSAMAASLILRMLNALRTQWRRLAMAVVVVLMLFGAATVILKVTNDPSLGNQWLFYTPAELAPRTWMERYQIQQNKLWLGISDRLVWAYYFWEGSHPIIPKQYQWGRMRSQMPYTLISSLTRLHANRSGISLPQTSDQNRVYDNGEVQIYHSRARTPYQP